MQKDSTAEKATVGTATRSHWNRRKNSRFPVMLLEVKGKQFDKVFLAYAENIGTGGLRLAGASHPWNLRERIPIEFTLPDYRTKVECLAEVVWKKAVGPHSDVIGLRFVTLSEQTQKAFAGWIKEEKRKGTPAP